jgi:hypothetical protein
MVYLFIGWYSYKFSFPILWSNQTTHEWFFCIKIQQHSSRCISNYIFTCIYIEISLEHEMFFTKLIALFISRFSCLGISKLSIVYMNRGSTLWLCKAVTLGRSSAVGIWASGLDVLPRQLLRNTLQNSDFQSSSVKFPSKQGWKPQRFRVSVSRFQRLPRRRLLSPSSAPLSSPWRIRQPTADGGRRAEADQVSPVPFASDS